MEGRFDQLAGLTESHDPMLGVSLRDLGAKANAITGKLKTVAPTAAPILAELDKVLGEINGIAKRL